MDTVRRAPKFTPKSRTASGGHALPSAYIPELNCRVPRGFWGEFRGSTRTLPSYWLRAFSVNSSELASGWLIRLRMKSALGLRVWIFWLCQSKFRRDQEV